MDNYTLIQSAAQRRLGSERMGFSALSRIDQADRWAAWQASAGATRPARDAGEYIPPPEPQSEPPAPEPLPAPPPAPQRRSFELYSSIAARHRRIFGPQA